MNEEAPLNTTAHKTQKCNHSAMRRTRSGSETLRYMLVLSGSGRSMKAYMRKGRPNEPKKGQFSAKLRRQLPTCQNQPKVKQFATIRLESRG